MIAPLALIGRACACAIVATVPLTLGLLGLATPAAAHAELVGTEPASGATVTTLDSVRLIFSDVLGGEFSMLAVTGPDGARADSGASTVSGTEISVPVTMTAAGSYTVAYRVVSADGHPVEGSYAVSYAPPVVATAPPSSAPPAEPSPAPPPTPTPSPTPSTTASPTASSGPSPTSSPRPAARWGLGGGVIGGTVILAGLVWYRRGKDRRADVG